MKALKLSVTTYWLLFTSIVIITLFAYCILADIHIRAIGSITGGFLWGFAVAMAYHCGDGEYKKKDFLSSIITASFLGLTVALIVGGFEESGLVFILLWAGSVLGGIIASVIGVEHLKE